MYKAIVFDLDDTLYDYSSLNEGAVEQARRYAADALSVSGNTFNNAFVWARENTKQILNKTAACHNRLIYFQKTLERLGLPPAGEALALYEAYWGYILSHMCLRKGTKELLDYCRKHSIMIGVCTDLTAQIQHRKLRALGIAPYVDVLVTSEEAGEEKPAPQIFSMVLEKLSATPFETIYVGDSYQKDVVGAEQAGMTALWFMGDKNDAHTVASMQEVQERIR